MSEGESSHWLSFANLITTATVTASSTAVSYTIDAVKDPGRPYATWRSTGIGATTIVINLGSAKPVDKVTLINGNFRFSVQANTADSWGAPAFSGPPAAVSLDPDANLYRSIWERAPLTPLTWQWLRIVIPAQTPVGNVGYFELGGIHLGTWTRLPRSPRPGYKRAARMHRLRTTSEFTGISTSVTTGPRRSYQTWTRWAEKTPENPGADDEYGQWLAIDAAIDAAHGKFAHHVGHWGPAAVWMHEQVNETDWQDIGLVRVEDDWVLSELVMG